jgi:isopentenyl diphosphate isomerase/L-lactate dehydrogenase-like FMN-dependent dehydrogenase
MSKRARARPAGKKPASKKSTKSKPAKTKLAADMVEEFQVLHEFVTRARQRLDDNNWDYLMGGADTETTHKRNRQAFDSIAFRPRVLNDVSGLDASGSMVGQKLRIPVMLAPIGSMQDLVEGGGAVSAEAAAEFGTVSILSSVCTPGLEAVAKVAPGKNRIFQLYVRGDAAWIDDYGRRAIANGYSAFCFTVDLDHYGRRERSLAKRYMSTARRAARSEIFQERFSWDDIKRFKDAHDIPLIVKGIATAEDAARAVAIGVDAIYVSNHGGRQLDHGRGAVEVLPEVVAAVNGRAEIVVDGGVMRGTDVVKAMALGADAVAIGRLQGLAAAAAGAPGVVRMLELLEAEVKIALALLGLPSFAGLDSSYLHPAAPVGPAHAFSAFPLLDEGY